MMLCNMVVPGKFYWGVLWGEGRGCRLVSRYTVRLYANHLTQERYNKLRVLLIIFAVVQKLKCDAGEQTQIPRRVRNIGEN